MFDKPEKGKMKRETREHAHVLAIVAAAFRDDPEFWEWHRIADVLQESGSAERLLQGEWTGFEPEDAERLRDAAIEGGAREAVDDYADLIRAIKSEGYGLVTVLEDAYPANLTAIYNRPPFLFFRGDLIDSDRRAIAVVGTRSASPEGLRLAQSLSGQLAERGVTVISGLAHGIDEAAHQAALVAGGRTIAVMGTGIRRTYPPANKELRSWIESQGAAISQFWPDAPPRQFNFPMRNVVTSGMSLGTVVIEAGPTSGAKNQARRALEHGKHLFLVESLVLQEEWAQRYSKRPRTRVVRSVEDILPVLDEVLAPPEQLTLTT